MAETDMADKLTAGADKDLVDAQKTSSRSRAPIPGPMPVIIRQTQKTDETPQPVGFIRQFELVDLVKAYDPDADEDLLNGAYVYAMKAHGGQTRASGEALFFASPRSRGDINRTAR